MIAYIVIEKNEHFQHLSNFILHSIVESNWKLCVVYELTKITWEKKNSPENMWLYIFVPVDREENKKRRAFFFFKRKEKPQRLPFYIFKIQMHKQ